MKITIGSDHRGYALKESLKKAFSAAGVNASIEWIDVGTDSEERVDYPIFAARVCEKIEEGVAERGVLICGSGIGVSIAANRHKKIYAALCWSIEVAKAARQHDRANVLVLPADFISENEAISIVEAWLHTEFLGGRYKSRLDMIDAI